MSFGNRRLAPTVALVFFGAASMFVAAGRLSARQTHRNPIIASENSAGSAVPNSSAVPDGYAITGHFDRIVILRFKYKVDLLAELKKMVKQEKIRNGVILACIGSVRGYQVHEVSNRTFPSKDVYQKNLMEPADIVSMNGYVVNGVVHPHITLATANGVVGGHLELGTEVFTYAIVTIGVMDGTDLSHVDDESYR